jgi:hypothetical protein
MGLSTSQSITYQRIRTSSASKQAVALSDDAIRALIFIAARDMGLVDQYPEMPQDLPELFEPQFDAEVVVPGPSPTSLFERICQLRTDADTYVACLASLHKARLKYRKVLATQPFARMDQVGPRGLLQFGLIEVPALAALLVWRKWLYDIDNRAAQDTGYLVEPVIAGALGGTPYSARVSPIKRASDPRKGRQVDCIKNDYAYEFKLRMTIAASGQGRWAEEIGFAEDVRSSGYIPVLVVLDPTESTKLVQLKANFEAAGGHCYIGDEAWQHLYAEAQPDMRAFLGKYVETPLRSLFEALPTTGTLPTLEVHDAGANVKFVIGDHTWTVQRENIDPELALEDEVPRGAGEFLPGVG